MTASNPIAGKMAARLAANSNVFFAVALVAILATLLIPLPTFLLDIGLACSMSLAIAILIIVLGANEPIELSTFPSLLLITTLFRLSLNVASTRLILLHGNAGEIISTFGNLVTGSSLIVGLVMFLILVVIQFVVITKGAGRISEVSARFVLDAMPGKQMAIDADLNAGTITEKEAKARRDAIVKESEFYGAMDGASKFISGDAKAGLIITAVNLIGGIILGYTRGMSISDAVRQYSILSIGDGLVSQIPSIIIAVSSGFLVSKIRSENTVSFDMTRQMFKRNQPLMIAAFVIATFALVPGFPKLPFILLAGACGTLAYTMAREQEKGPAAAPAENREETKKEEGASAEELLQADILSVLVGVRLISLVDPRKKSSVFERIGALRKKFAQKYGFIIPLVRLRDSISLDPTAYEIRLYDHVIASGNIEPGKFLAMDPGTVQKPIKGQAAKEPVYGLPALWINETEKEYAEMSGYTVIDPESVLMTHLSETLSRHAADLLTREDVQGLLERLRKTQPSLVGEVVPEVVSVGLLQRILQNLLREGVSIRDLPLILEALGEHGGRTKNAALLTEFGRKALARCITGQLRASDGKVYVISLDPALEHGLVNSVSQTADSIQLSVGPDVANRLSRQIAKAWKSVMEKGVDQISLICDARIRPGIKSLLSRLVHQLAVVAYDEIVTGVTIEPLETVVMPDVSVGTGPVLQPA
ncbi:MAG: flagellar biosynthesis protein FlhA [Planctomycetaceae bacterium]|nr:flagellar biosynthesis protein FlhA [Planctomycetaceae bacterium]